MSANASTSSAPPPLMPSSLSPTLPSTSSTHSHPSPPMASPSNHSPETQRQIAEARAALEASMTNIGSSLDSTLRSRAQNLHSNSAQLTKQEKDLAKATNGLRKENQKLQKLAEEGSRKVKELGNVQNWAEMLERDFLVLSETMRLANKGSDSEDSWETDSYSSNEGRGDERMMEGEWLFKAEDETDVDGEGDTQMDGLEEAGPISTFEKGKGKETVRAEEVGHAAPAATPSVMQMQHTEEPNHETVGGSSTATTTTGSTTDPSSGSVHTAASATS